MAWWVSGMQPQIGQVGFGQPCPDLFHTANDLGQCNPMRKQLRNLPSACQIAKPEQTTSWIEQAEPYKLIDGAAGELAQRGDLIRRIGPMQAIGDRFSDPLQKAALAYRWNAIGARSTQLVGWSTIIQQRPAEFADNKHVVWRVTVWLGVPPCWRTTSNAFSRLMQARRPVKATVLLSVELSTSRLSSRP